MNMNVSLKLTTAMAAISALAMPAVSASANSNTPKLHPVEKVCIDYTMTGQMMNGTTTRCHRDFAYEQYEIQDMTVGFGGFTQTQQSHVITIGETIYNINTATNTATQATNPFYSQMVSALSNSSPSEMGAAFMSGMGFTATGSSKTIAGMSCATYSSAQMGNVCMTENGLMLEQSFMGNTQTATSVNVGSAGDAANYTAYQQASVSQAPDLSNGLQGLMDQYGAGN